jgi:hypothetical protein
MSEAPDAAAAETPPAEGVAPVSSLTGEAPAAASEGAPPEDGQGEPAKAEGQGTVNGEVAKEGDADAEGEKPKEGEGEATQGAPEQYAAFTIADGWDLGQDHLTQIETLAKGMNLPQSEAQKLVDLAVQLDKAMVTEFGAEAQKTPVPMVNHWAQVWSQQTAKDTEIGGDKLGETMGLAQRVVSTFASPDFIAFLNETGIAHHPEMVRFMHKVGKAVSEDTLVAPRGGTPGPAKPGQNPASKLYPSMAA